MVSLLCRATVVLVSSLMYDSPLAKGSSDQGTALAHEIKDFLAHLVQAMEVLLLLQKLIRS